MFQNFCRSYSMTTLLLNKANASNRLCVILISMGPYKKSKLLPNNY